MSTLSLPLGVGKEKTLCCRVVCLGWFVGRSSGFQFLLGFFPLYFGFGCISGLRFWGCFHAFWVGFFCSLGFMGVSSGFWVLGGFGYCVCVGPCGFSSVA